jgi:hypothetical protein
MPLAPVNAALFLNDAVLRLVPVQPVISPETLTKAAGNHCIAPPRRVAQVRRWAARATCGANLTLVTCPFFVIPAKAGIQGWQRPQRLPLVRRFRGGDNNQWRCNKWMDR